ncbi:hypothetical protein D3C72_591550 [compost metagenome]
MQPLFEDNFDELIGEAWSRFFAAFPLTPSYMGAPEETVFGSVFVGGGSTEHGEAHIVYDPETNNPFEIMVRSYRTDDDSYRWVHPAHAVKRTEVVGYDNPPVKLTHVIEQEQWHETESIDDIIDKVEKLLRGEDHDHKVVMVLDLEEEHIKFYDELAEKKGITRDEAIELVIRKELKKLDKKAFPNGNSDFPFAEAS